MKKTKVSNFVLLVLPLMMVLVAANPAGVTVFDGETTRTMSWMQTVPDSVWGWCAPVAALANYVSFALAVIFCLTKKNWCLKSIFALSFAASCIAALPIVIQAEIKIVPSVFGTMLLGAQCLVAYRMAKTPAAEKPKGERLARQR